MEIQGLEKTHTGCPDITVVESRYRRGWNTQKDILITSAFFIFPMTILAASLVAVVVHYGVWRETQESLLFSLPETSFNNGFFYVDVDTTSLMYLASRISSVANILAGAGVILASYPIAQRFLRHAEQKHGRLLTPLQLGLTVKFVEGSSWGGLWSLLQYHLNWEHHEKIWGTPLAWIVTVDIIVILMSVLVFGADTWLHFATQTTSITRFTPYSPQHTFYSYEPLSDCTSTNNSVAAIGQTSAKCVVNATAAMAQYDIPPLLDAATTTEVLNNQSSSISVLEYSDSVSYLAPTSHNPNIDYIATTYGVRTLCSPISQACNLTYNGNMTYNCSGGYFAANDNALFNAGLLYHVFKSPDLAIHDDMYQSYGVNNPFYAAAASLNVVPRGSGLEQDPEIAAIPGAQTIATIFQCEVTVMDITYSQVQGTTNITSMKPSNISMTNMFVSGWKQPSNFGTLNIQTAMAMAAILSNNAQDFAQHFQRGLSSVILASGAGSVVSAPVKAAQYRSETLVAKLPKAPFLLLIVADVAFVLVGFVLAVLALCTKKDGREAQYHLTIPGLVANACDRDNVRKEASHVEELFGEYHGKSGNVGYNRTSQGGLVLQNLTQKRHKGAQQHQVILASQSPFVFNQDFLPDGGCFPQTGDRNRSSWV